MDTLQKSINFLAVSFDFDRPLCEALVVTTFAGRVANRLAGDPERIVALVSRLLELHAKTAGVSEDRILNALRALAKELDGRLK